MTCHAASAVSLVRLSPTETSRRLPPATEMASDPWPHRGVPWRQMSQSCDDPLPADSRFGLLDRDDVENEEEARREERENAQMAFDKLDFLRGKGWLKGWLKEDQFEALMRSAFTAYSIEYHRPKLLSLCRGDRLYRKEFMSWYEAWLFGSTETRQRLPPATGMTLDPSPHRVLSWQLRVGQNDDDPPPDGSRFGFVDRDDAENKEEARREERANAQMAFDKLDVRRNGWLRQEEFRELMLSTNATYSVEYHRPKLLSICREGDRLYRKEFLSWYEAWLFGSIDSSAEEQTSGFDQTMACSAERRGKRVNAPMIFDKLDFRGNGWLQEDQFEELMLSTIAAYSIEDHRPKLLSLCRGDRLYRNTFLSWHYARLCGKEDIYLSCDTTKPSEEINLAASMASGESILGGSSGGLACTLTSGEPPDAATAGVAGKAMPESPTAGVLLKHGDGEVAAAASASGTPEQKAALSLITRQYAELEGEIERQAELLSATLQASEDARRGDRTCFDDERRRFEAEKKEFETERGQLVGEIARSQSKIEEMRASVGPLARLPTSSKQALASISGLHIVLEECMICSEVLLSGIGAPSFGVTSYSCGCSHVRTLHVNCMISMSSLKCPYCSEEVVVIAPSLMAQSLVRNISVRKL